MRTWLLGGLAQGSRSQASLCEAFLETNAALPIRVDGLLHPDRSGVGRRLAAPARRAAAEGTSLGAFRAIQKERFMLPGANSRDDWCSSSLAELVGITEGCIEEFRDAR